MNFLKKIFLKKEVALESLSTLDDLLVSDNGGSGRESAGIILSMVDINNIPEAHEISLNYNTYIFYPKENLLKVSGLQKNDEDIFFDMRKVLDHLKNI